MEKATWLAVVVDSAHLQETIPQEFQALWGEVPCGRGIGLGGDPGDGCGVNSPGVVAENSAKFP